MPDCPCCKARRRKARWWRSRSSRSIRCGPSRCPNEALLGMAIGVSVDDQDNVWIVHRGASTLNNNEKGADPQPAGLALLPVGAAGDRVQPGRRRGACLGRPGAGLRVAGIDARRLCRLQGQCLARRQRRQGLRRSSNSRKDGKFLMQSGHYGKNAGSNDPENFGRVAQIYRRPEDQRSLRGRRLPQQARRGARRRHRQDQALLGCLRQQARRQPAGTL